MKKLAVICIGLMLLFACHTAAHAQARLYAVQLASMSSETEAKTLIAELAAAGIQAYLVKADVPENGTRYRVRFGRFTKQAEARAKAEQALQRQTIKEYLVTFYDAPAEAAKPSRAPTEVQAAITPQAVRLQKPAPLSPAQPQTQLQTQASDKPLVHPLPQRSVGLESGRSVRWTLRDAIMAALEKNLEIELERSNVRLAEFDLRAAAGVYDRTSTLGTSYNALTQANTRLFSGTDAATTNSRTLSYNFGLQQLLQRGGGGYQVDFLNQRNANNFGTLSPQYNPQLSFSFTQPLFRNYKLDAFRRQIKIAKKRQALSDAVFRQRAIEIVAQVQEAYWNLALALKHEEIQRDSVKLAEAQMRINQRQVELGTRSELEVVQSAAALETRRQQVFQAMEVVVQAENALKSLTVGAPGDKLWTAQILPVESFSLGPVPLPLDDALKLAKEHRPEFKQLLLQKESNQVDLDFFRNQIKPQVDLVSSYSMIGVAGSKNSGLVTTPPTCVTTNPPAPPGCIPPAYLGSYPAALNNLFRNDFRSWQVGVNLSLPWRNSVTKANFGRAKEQDRQLDLQTRRMMQTIELEVRNAVQTIEAIKLRIEAARAATDYTSQQLEGEQKKFQAGLSTTLLVLERQTDRARARGTEIQALADYNKAVAQLQRIISTTLTDNGIEIKSEIEPAAKKLRQ